MGRFRGNVRLEWELRACDCNQMDMRYTERNRELYIFLNYMLLVFPFLVLTGIYFSPLVSKQCDILNGVGGKQSFLWV